MIVLLSFSYRSFLFAFLIKQTNIFVSFFHSQQIWWQFLAFSGIIRIVRLSLRLNSAFCSHLARSTGQLTFRLIIDCLTIVQLRATVRVQVYRACTIASSSSSSSTTTTRSPRRNRVSFNAVALLLPATHLFAVLYMPSGRCCLEFAATSTISWFASLGPFTATPPLTLSLRATIQLATVSALSRKQQEVPLVCE